ncbi:hypothetical protein EHQ12_14485 [Leptospira gomenensis]|uniref:STAS domain-containing protein n=1 Tax=Leptospira gomenensis TaxID=2484974 RepID=A0A5F1YQH6_9LEPT|nr:STAS domain-containing protein [Leptospira gomenensis]TGK33879.1 hypothetical protein EHQ17_10285 [Leptospira gomenensis]TGK36334.1 hypothetical protein EHQ12_14485 [Leptospira gomenensis]TGK52104.1 hypothetical protein EHQ07_00580 [Leptospira gomenensis]TGK59847.1 hypothetical protein EHQ13_11475 [Leptospira gomenensis]
MKEIIINLQGDLDFKLGESLLSKLEELSEFPRKILLDGSGLDSATLEGSSIVNRLPQKFPDSKFAVCSLAEGIDLSGEGDNGIPTFPDRETAKSFLTENETDPETKFPENAPVLIQCPECFHLLKIQSSGNYACPSCSSKFFVTKDFRTSPFERLL